MTESSWEPVEELTDYGLYHNAATDEYELVPRAETASLQQLGVSDPGVIQHFASRLLAGAPTEELRSIVPAAHRTNWTSFAEWFLHDAGLTAEENFEGVIPAAALAYYYLGPPIETLWVIEKQTVGVLEQLHSWLGGAGSAIAHGEQTLGGSLKTLGSDAAKWLGSAASSASSAGSSSSAGVGGSASGAASSASGSSSSPSGGTTSQSLSSQGQALNQEGQSFLGKLSTFAHQPHEFFWE